MSKLIHTIADQVVLTTAGTATLTYIASKALDKQLEYCSTGVLYVRTFVAAATPSLKVEVQNYVIGGQYEAESLDKTHATTNNTLEAYCLGFSPSLAAEGAYAVARDTMGPIHPGVHIKLTCSGASAGVLVDAELILTPQPIG